MPMKQAMNEAQQRALALAFQLKGEGKTWAEVEKALEREGFKDSKDNPYTAGNLKAWYSKLKGEVPQVAEQSEPVEADKVDAQAERGMLDTLTREEVTAMLEALETRLRVLIEKELGAAKLEPCISAVFPEVEEPPLPPKTGKKYAGTKADIRVRVDENLGKLFEADVNQRFGGNASRCMDAILWNYYGKPALSFESERSEKGPDA
jgi:hypothetical protein